MFFHHQGLQFEATPDNSDPVYARKLQELLGGAWGEITVSLQYLFQGWNCRMPGKYKDVLMDIGTEELAHVEMLSVMISKLLEGAPEEQSLSMMKKDPALAAVMGGMDPQHAIIGGLGPMPSDSNGYPWNGRYVVASGNLLADFRANVTAESQGRLQATRLFGMTDDAGVKDLLRFLIARDTMHQNQWLAAIESLAEEGLETTPCPSSFPQSEENGDVNYVHMDLSKPETTSADGRWAAGPSIDGRGEFSYVRDPEPSTAMQVPPKPAPHLYTTGGKATGVVNTVKDKLTPG